MLLSLDNRSTGGSRIELSAPKLINLLSRGRSNFLTVASGMLCTPFESAIVYRVRGKVAKMLQSLLSLLGFTPAFFELMRNWAYVLFVMCLFVFALGLLIVTILYLEILFFE